MTRCIPIIIFIISICFGIPGMHLSADIQKNIDAADSVDFATAIKEWIFLAKQGDVVAQFNLGLTFHEGRIVPQDYKTAMKWYILAAEQGDAAIINRERVIKLMTPSQIEQARKLAKQCLANEYKGC